MVKHPSTLLRAADILLALAGLAIACPALIIFIIVGYIDTRSPLFRQQRVGAGEQPFMLTKFRTMRARHCRHAYPRGRCNLHHALGTLPAKNKTGRTTPTLERAQRRDEPGRPTALPAQPASAHRGPTQTGRVQRAPGDNRPRPDYGCRHVDARAACRVRPADAGDTHPEQVPVLHMAYHSRQR